MAYRCYDKLWRSELYNNVSANNRVQDKNFNQLKLKVIDGSRRNERTTVFYTFSDEDDINKVYLGTKFSKTEGHISLIE